MNVKKIIDSVALAALMFTIGGCAMYSKDAVTVSNETEAFVKPANIYDSEDAAVVVKKDVEAKTIQLQNISTSRRYTLHYDGTTNVFDKNDEAMSMQQLKEGSVVTARFYKPEKSLSYIKENKDALRITDISNYELDLKNGKITVGGESYSISGNVVVSSNGKETDPMELNAVDEISIWGYQDRIYGINVEKGHGYLRLQNEDYFVNGWLDVGDKVIRKIEEDMLLVVPEGTYNAMVSNKGSSAMQEISFARNEEMVWDLGDVEITVVQTGKIIFTLTPATAKLAIDGREVNTSKPVELQYGLHSMRITAEGYDTVAQYIKVGEPSANISVELQKSSEPEKQETQKTADVENKDDDEPDENTVNKKYETRKPDQDEEDDDEKDKDEKDKDKKDKDEKEDNETSSKASDSDAVASSSDKYKVYIDAPEDVEAYLDGSYIGLTPVSFPKTAGNHVITLRKTGYQTRSYTLQIDSEKKDVNYSFTELVEREE
ncbi:MAG: PEGA domain-containing protein [Lachnospiraceae bacterium]|nr:PEGA domain-containing protein [Lachnospiraceae bacterium]